MDYSALMVFCLVWGMGGAFISLALSRFIAKRAMGVQLVDGRTGQAELDWLYAHGPAAHAIAPGCRCPRSASTIRRK